MEKSQTEFRLPRVQGSRLLLGFSVDISVVESELSRILSLALRQEHEYNWANASQLYNNALENLFRIGPFKQGEIYERLGNALFYAARQAQTVSEFRQTLELAVDALQKARDSFEKESTNARKDVSLRCTAATSFLNSFLESDPVGKKTLLEECWSIATKALRSFELAGRSIEYAETFNRFASAASLAAAFERDFEARKKIVDEVLECGEKAISNLSSTEEKAELAKAYVKTATYLEAKGGYFADPAEKERHSDKALNYWNKAIELSEQSALLELSCSFNFILYSSLGWGDGTPKSFENWHKALDYAKGTRDNLTIGCALDMLAHHSFWKAFATEDSTERESIVNQALSYSEDSNRHLSVVSFASPRGGTLWAGAPVAEYCWFLARFQVDVDKKRDLLRKGLEAAPDALRLASDSGYPEIIWTTHHVFSKLLVSLANLITNPDEKRSLLENALDHRKESISLNDRLEPYHYWNRGTLQSGMADVKSELAEVATSPEAREAILRDAILDMESCLNLCSMVVPLSDSLAAALGRWQQSHGDLLSRLYNLTKSQEHLQKAIQSYSEAVPLFKRSHQLTRLAECHWKTALANDTLAQYDESARQFASAGESYKAAAENLPQLNEFYTELAFYMQAWVEIEHARHHHKLQEYGQAKESYERAASLHHVSQRLASLSPNYSAWANVEAAEDLSRKDEGQKAIEAFRNAITLFANTRESIANSLPKAQSPEERDMVVKMIKASDLREEYCNARILLEESKLLLGKGNDLYSAEKYGQAADSFGKLAERVDSDQDRKELKLIATLSSAWQAMALAEEEAAPKLYLEASQLFEQAKDLSSTEKTRMLALGNSRFCKALESGARFADSADSKSYTTAMEYLESAAKYYQRAGFPGESEYVEATELLFEAYSYVDRAKKERDEEKRVKLYSMAERVLLVSADSFQRSGHQGKRSQAMGLLENVRKGRKLALSLVEILQAPASLSSTSTFTPPTPSFEKAVGLQRLETGNVVGRLKVPDTQLQSESDFTYEVELVNVGKTTATLVKLDSIVPDGCQLDKSANYLGIEDGSLSLGGKRLEHLGSHQVKISLKAVRNGTLSLRPVVWFFDDKGSYKSQRIEGVSLTVAGILSQQFSPLMVFLAKAFVEDYMVKRLSLEHAGWRTLMDIVESLHIPKAQVYGDARYGHTFGKPLDSLVKGGLVEYRIVPGVRGRGGNVMKVRVAYDRQPVKELVNEIALEPSEKTGEVGPVKSQLFQKK